MIHRKRKRNWKSFKNYFGRKISVFDKMDSGTASGYAVTIEALSPLATFGLSSRPSRRKGRFSELRQSRHLLSLRTQLNERELSWCHLDIFDLRVH